ncbi:MAG: hypothetical protein U0R52_11875 [Solirubrobacterales bacterium]
MQGPRGLRPRLSYANVVATLALFLALGGAAYAAFKLPPDSVRSRNIVKGQVKTSDLGKGAVTRAKIAAPEKLRYVGRAGQPPFSSDSQRAWSNLGSTGSEVTFYKDQLGIVHLSGTALCSSVSGECGNITAGPIFTLPPGYRPPVTGVFEVRVTSDAQGTVEVIRKGGPQAGQVYVLRDNAGAGGALANVSLDGIAFRGS